MQVDRAERIERAWAELAGVSQLQPLQILVRPRSRLGREGWVAVLCIGSKLVIAVPERGLVARVEGALSGVPRVGIRADEVLAALPHGEVLGPASLFYPPEARPLEQPPDVFRGGQTELDAFRRGLSEIDLDESGLRDVDSDVFAVRDDAANLVALCGYRRWPAHIAHLCVATATRHRRRGAGRRVALAAIADATRKGLLPQWRARPEASKALARSVGLEEWGFQLSLRLEE